MPEVRTQEPPIDPRRWPGGPLSRLPEHAARPPGTGGRRRVAAVAAAPRAGGAEPDGAGAVRGDGPLHLPPLQEVDGVAGQLRRAEAELPRLRPAPSDPTTGRP